VKDNSSATRIPPYFALRITGRQELRVFAGHSLQRIPPSIRRVLYRGYLPIVQLHFRDQDGTEYRLETFAAPDEDEYDNYMHISVRQPSDRRGRAVVGFAFVSDRRSHASDRPRAWFHNLSFRRLTPQSYLVHCGCVSLMNLQTTGRLFVRDRKLVVSFQPNEMQGEIYARFPGYVDLRDIPEPPQASAADVETRYSSARRQIVEEWERFLRSHPSIDVPEPKVAHCYRAALVQQFITRDGGVLKPGEGFYEDLYLRDAAYQIHALDVMGYIDEAEESLQKCLAYQRPDGRFESQPLQLDANGYMLWAIAEHYRLKRDRNWLAGIFPYVKKSVAWLLSTLQHTEHPFAGVLPAAPADGENLWDGDCHIVGYDLWNLRGLMEASFAARELGYSPLADQWEAASEQYRRAIRNNILKRGYDFLPPSYEGRGTHWGNLEVLFPTPVMDPDDYLVENTLRRVESTYREGVMLWSPNTARVIHPYATSFAQMSRLYQGHYQKAVEGFYSQLLHTTAAHGFAEGIYYDRREAWRGTIPHQWGSALFLIYLRRLLIEEGRNTLLLCPAVPDHWLSNGNLIRCEKLPTHFGRLSLQVGTKGATLNVHAEVPNNGALKETFLYLPPGWEFADRSHLPPGVLRIERTRIQLAPGVHTFTIRLRHPPAPRERSFEERAAEFTTPRSGVQ